MCHVAWYFGSTVSDFAVTLKKPGRTATTRSRRARTSQAKPEVLILSENRARRYVPAGKEICISVTDPGKPTALLSDRFLAVLRLAFTDIAEYVEDPWDVVFTPQHAGEIVRFVQKWRDVDRVVIHCRAGLSRSPGIAMGLCDVFSWPLGEMEREHPLCNKWVRRELARVGREVTKKQ
jgi:predicted protein tyrosine phosphatase